ncbi:unnamed protein product [Schistosoma mattheei]|uniref:Uncharacterized protein n=1 Tax=Schistosoma mattheei TaxID=31246 RepID=A0A183P2H5_9TREM|nr:unnamed protein product [Schistosoma mattheei]
MSSSQSLNFSIGNLIDSSEAVNIIALQESMLTKFEKTNEMLRTVSELSDGRCRILFTELTTHTKTIISLKKEMDDVFKRIRSIKKLLCSNFPEDMERLHQHFCSRDSDDNEDCDVIPKALQTSDCVTISKTMETVCEDSSLE